MKDNIFYDCELITRGKKSTTTKSIYLFLQRVMRLTPAVADVKILASAGWDKSIRIWDVKTGECVNMLTGHTHDVNSVIELYNGTIASASNDKSIQVWDIIGADRLCMLRGHSSFVKCIIQLTNGRIVSASSDKTVRIWDAREDRPLISTLEGHTFGVCALAQLNHNTIASGSFDMTIRLCKMTSLNN